MPKAKRPPSPLRGVFGANLRKARKARGLSVFDVAYASKTEWSYISQIERGERNVGLDVLDALAGAVGFKVVDLLDETADFSELGKVSAGDGTTVQGDSGNEEVTPQEGSPEESQI